MGLRGAKLSASKLIEASIEEIEVPGVLVSVTGMEMLEPLTLTNPNSRAGSAKAGIQSTNKIRHAKTLVFNHPPHYIATGFMCTGDDIF